VERISRERVAVQPQIIEVSERFRRKDKFVRKAAKLIQNVRCTETCHSDEKTKKNFQNWATERLAMQVDDFLSAMPDEHGDLTALHQFRVRGKAFRYTIELLASALPVEVRETHYRTVETLQEHLGRINDHASARDRLREWAAETSDAELADALCSIAKDEVARLTAELGAWRDWWTPERIENLRQGLRYHEPQPPSDCGEEAC
jgi:hypothetical protein